jgi:hypothetical protein
MRPLPRLSRKLRELGFARYSDYLESEHWRALKAAWEPRRTRNKKPVCEFCLAGDRRLDLHHRTYKRLGSESPRDLVLICDRCHSRIHRWFANGHHRTLGGATGAVARTARR